MSELPQPPSPPPPPRPATSPPIAATLELSRLQSLTAGLAVVSAGLSLPASSLLLLVFGCPCVDPLAIAAIAVGLRSMARASPSQAVLSAVLCVPHAVLWTVLAYSNYFDSAGPGLDGGPLFWLVPTLLAVPAWVSAILAARVVLS